MCGCNLGCRRHRRPSGLSLAAITCTVVRMMANPRRHHGRKAYVPTRSGIIINRAVSASLAALRAMPPGSRPMLSVTKGGLQPGAAPGCGRSRALLRRCADAPRDRCAIAERRFVRSRCVTADSRHAARLQPGLARDPSSEYARASAAKLRPALQWLRGPGSRTRVRSCCARLASDAVECGRLSAAKARAGSARRRARGPATWTASCGACRMRSCIETFHAETGTGMCMQKLHTGTVPPVYAVSHALVCSFCIHYLCKIEGQPPKFQSAVAHN
jgi:hypothetical protein